MVAESHDKFLAGGWIKTGVTGVLLIGTILYQQKIGLPLHHHSHGCHTTKYLKLNPRFNLWMEHISALRPGYIYATSWTHLLNLVCIRHYFIYIYKVYKNTIESWTTEGKNNLWASNELWYGFITQKVMLIFFHWYIFVWIYSKHSRHHQQSLTNTSME